MTAFVLVHGAWHGSWAWEPVVPLLEHAGATVNAPELSANAEVGLADHVEEVIAVLDRSKTAVVLVGHSYAGLVIRQAADWRPAKVARIVLIDGWAGPHGASLLTLAPDWFGDGIRAAAAGNGGELIPAPGPIAFGIDDPVQAAWLEPRLRPQPLRTFTDATVLTGTVDRVPGAAIHSRPENFPFAQLARDLGYTTIPVDGPHDVMLTDPQAISQRLLAAAEDSALA
jgi:pimeloyl-ACP methyl ester carboxylesterase